MASINYGMGQLRFNSSSDYLMPINPSYKELTVVKTSSTSTDTGSNSWRDLIIGNKDSASSSNTPIDFDPNTTYLLKIAIPKDENYDCNFTVKLISSYEDISTQTTGYQVIRYLSVPAANTQAKNSRILLYPLAPSENYLPWSGAGDESNRVRAVIPLNYQDIGEGFYPAGTVFYNVIGQIYEYAVLNANYNYDGESGLPEWGDNPFNNKILNKNDTVLNWTWALGEHNTDAVTFNIIFKPKVAGYKYLWIQMDRTEIDWDISDGNSIGRQIDVDNPNYFVKLYSLGELIGEGENNPLPKGITNIGLHSHPNLLFSLNGEELKTGRSGYYELNDFDITSLCIAAENSNDYFVLDYQYKITS